MRIFGLPPTGPRKLSTSRKPCNSVDQHNKRRRSDGGCDHSIPPPQPQGPCMNARPVNEVMGARMGRSPPAVSTSASAKTGTKRAPARRRSSWTCCGLTFRSDSRCNASTGTRQAVVPASAKPRHDRRRDAAQWAKCGAHGGRKDAVHARKARRHLRCARHAPELPWGSRRGALPGPMALSPSVAGRMADVSSLGLLTPSRSESEGLRIRATTTTVSVRRSLRRWGGVVCRGG
jgi:hypothetical protein